MKAQEIRQKYLEFCEKNGHAVIPRAKLVLKDDPTTLFTGAGMQPLLPYLLGKNHPDGTRLADSQTCFRAEDVDEVGDNRHTTFFEMLGNWSLGDYFKKEQLPWFFEFLTDIVGLDASKLYVTCFIGDDEFGIPKDTESAEIWHKLFASKNIDARDIEIGSEKDGAEKGMQGGRIFYYDGSKNWWSRGGAPKTTPVGDPCGPDSEVFYEFTEIEHNPAFGEQCHPNCDCGRFMEIGNSVFMTYRRTENGFEPLTKKNVDFGGGLERIAAASLNSSDMFKISLLAPIIEKLEGLSGKSYDDYATNMRVIADHLRAATFLITDSAEPSNKEQGYVVRRLMRRAIRFAFDLGIEEQLMNAVVPVVTDLYKSDFPELAANEAHILDVMAREEKVFRQTLRAGVKHFQKQTRAGHLTGEIVFKLYDTYGFPVELSLEEASRANVSIQPDWQVEFDAKMDEQKARSRTATKGQFKGGLGGDSLAHKKLHTANHLMYAAIRKVLGDDIFQHGSNITEERLRFDFNFPRKVTREELDEIEKLVNEQIASDLPVSYEEYPTNKAFQLGAVGAFGDRYGDKVKVYQMGEGDGRFSFEICGGPHVTHTGQLAEGGKVFKITKEEASSAGVRRVKAILTDD